MAKQTPYLQRRGDTFSFRIAVPSDLLPVVGKREFIKSLRTTDKYIAVPLALQLAATAKQLFNGLKGNMQESDKSKLMELLREKKHKLRLDEQAEQHEDELIDLRLSHYNELKQAKLEAANDAFKSSLESFQASKVTRPASAIEMVPQGLKVASVPMFEAVINGFLKSYQQDKKRDMFRKHQTVLPMLLEIIENKPITELKQADINRFFALLDRLPPRWTDECRKRKLTIKQLAELEHPLTLGPKSFEDTYKACIRAFLKVAKKDWQDQGFPTTLTTDGIDYKGNREEGEKAQRAFTLAELKRLFKGGEMKAFRQNPAQAHYFWLPHIGFFTGARVNEICQLNPQADILKDEESSIWYFWITEETEGDDRIHKSTKNKTSKRKVPIHSILQKLGFLEYAERVKKQGAKLLFPAWKPVRGKASGQAEKWFRQLIKDTGLRDDTPYARIVGMHAFRNTLLNRASNANPPINAEPITGHAGEKTRVVRGYEGELSLENKSRALEAIPFGLDLNALSSEF